MNQHVFLILIALQDIPPTHTHTTGGVQAVGLSFISSIYWVTEASSLSLYNCRFQSNIMDRNSSPCKIPELCGLWRIFQAAMFLSPENSTGDSPNISVSNLAEINLQSLCTRSEFTAQSGHITSSGEPGENYTCPSVSRFKRPGPTALSPQNSLVFTTKLNLLDVVVSEEMKRFSEYKTAKHSRSVTAPPPPVVFHGL